MKKRILIITLLLVVALLLCGCVQEGNQRNLNYALHQYKTSERVQISPPQGSQEQGNLHLDNKVNFFILSPSREIIWHFLKD